MPTAETAALRYFLDMMVSLGKPIMFVGGAGVGELVLLRPCSIELPWHGISAAVLSASALRTPHCLCCAMLCPETRPPPARLLRRQDAAGEGQVGHPA